MHILFKEENRYSSLAQSVERMTVNHDVVGSSPTRGAKAQAMLVLFFELTRLVSTRSRSTKSNIWYVFAWVSCPKHRFGLHRNSVRAHEELIMMSQVSSPTRGATSEQVTLVPIFFIQYLPLRYPVEAGVDQGFQEFFSAF